MAVTQVAYDIDPDFACWLWTGKVDKLDGRPIVWLGKRPIAAHRYVFERELGPIPSDPDDPSEKLELDHTCCRPACVNPTHMEPVTREENEKRKNWRYRARLTRCKRGHNIAGALAGVTPEGGRVCRTCRREDERR